MHLERRKLCSILHLEIEVSRNHLKLETSLTEKKQWNRK